MPRSVNAVAARARRKKVMKQAKGYFGRRKNVWTVAKNAVDKAMQYAYRDRRQKKRNFRSLWITRINAGARMHGMSYSQFMGKVKANDIELNRKVLADLAVHEKGVFAQVAEQAKAALEQFCPLQHQPRTRWRQKQRVAHLFNLERMIAQQLLELSA